jgi:hypothetical protein
MGAACLLLPSLGTVKNASSIAFRPSFLRSVYERHAVTIPVSSDVWLLPASVELLTASPD